MPKDCDPMFSMCPHYLLSACKKCLRAMSLLESRSLTHAFRRRPTGTCLTHPRSACLRSNRAVHHISNSPMLSLSVPALLIMWPLTSWLSRKGGGQLRRTSWLQWPFCLFLIMFAPSLLNHQPPSTSPVAMETSIKADHPKWEPSKHRFSQSSSPSSSAPASP